MWRVLAPTDGVIRLFFGGSGSEQYLVAVDLTVGDHISGAERDDGWQLILSSNETRFGGDSPGAVGAPEVRFYGRKTSA
jgi:hypothetical protein